MEKKVLVIDDDPILLRLVEQVLTQKGYEVFNDSGTFTWFGFNSYTVI